MSFPDRDVLQWDTASWAPALRYWEHAVDWRQVQDGLELGSNLGGLSLWLAGHGVRTVCSDLDGVAGRAGPLHQRHGVQHLIQYRDLDATALPYAGAFDVVVFKSIIGGIGRHGQGARQREVFAQVHQALRPGGLLLYAENLAASPLHRWVRKRFVPWGASWRYPTAAELKEYLRPFAKHTLFTTGVSATFGRSEAQRRALARLDRVVLNALAPKAWRYIAYGMAVK